jgi:hypothetical protein
MRREVVLFSIAISFMLTTSMPAKLIAQEEAHIGSGRWIWEKSIDEMSDKVKFIFAERPISTTGNLSPVLVAAKVGTVWSLLLQVDSDMGEANEIVVTIRWGKDEPKIQTYSSGGPILMVIEPFDFKKMLTSPTFAVRCEKGTYLFDLKGLRETMKMAGCEP